jgi:hypothetical protein
LAVASWLSDRASHSVDVSLQRASKTLHRVEAGLLGVFQPDAQFANTLPRAGTITCNVTAGDEKGRRCDRKLSIGSLENIAASGTKLKALHNAG